MFDSNLIKYAIIKSVLQLVASALFVQCFESWLGSWGLTAARLAWGFKI